MSLQQRLDRIRESFEKKAPPEVLAVMHHATDDLRSSGIMDGVLQEGQSAPAFSLEDSEGREWNLADRLGAGPVVLTFYRGDW